ncbi:MAG: hypothetical protein WAV54_01895 [Acidimicrobiales bacterium]
MNSGTTSPGKSLNLGPSRDYGVCGAALEALGGVPGDGGRRSRRCVELLDL